MSRYREPLYDEVPDVSFEDLDTIEKLLKTKKLTDKQKKAIKNLLENIIIQ